MSELPLRPLDAHPRVRAELTGASEPRGLRGRGSARPENGAPHRGWGAVTTETLMRPHEVCTMLGVSRSWLYQAAADGRIPHVRLGSDDGPVRFVATDIEQWLEDARRRWTPGRHRPNLGIRDADGS
jgi:excisionase family DNA binding protein